MLHNAARRIPKLPPHKPFKLMNRPLYNELVSYYELIEGRDWDSEIRHIASILKKHHCESVIDLGCGTGFHCRALMRLGFETTGIDISKQNIIFARKRASEEALRPRLIVRSYYEYQPAERFDSALCLNWSIPVKEGEVKRFLNNTYSLLRPGGLLIFDFERTSQIVWSDVGRPIMDSWTRKNKVIVRVSVGELASNVLYSRDAYLIYHKTLNPTAPDERSRYKAWRNARVQTYVDRSCVRFFSMSEIREFAQESGFGAISSFILPRGKYKRNYVVLEKRK